MFGIKPILLTRHALLRMHTRGIAFSVVEGAVRTPLWTASDPRGPDVERRYYIDAGQGHFVRVACVETHKGIRVITVTYDRNARPPS